MDDNTNEPIDINDHQPNGTIPPRRFLSREVILKKRDLAVEEVDVPEWGGAVLVRELTGRERDAFEASLQASKTSDKAMNLQNFRAKLVALAIVDENRMRTFRDADIVELGQLSARALQRVFDVASKLAGMSKADVDELTGNSNAETDSSSSD